MTNIKNNFKLQIQKIINKNPYLISIIKALILIVRNHKYSFPNKKEIIDYKSFNCNIDKNKPINDIIFSTNQGVFILNNNNITKVLNGKFYGITKYKDYWILARSNNFTTKKSRRQSDICAVKIKNNQIKDYKTLLWGIPGEIHQIDIFENTLFIPHTGYNQILYIPLKKLFKINAPKNIKTILSCNYTYLNIFKPSHLNSIFYSKDSKKIYLIAHNSTAHTGKSSDIIVSDKLFCNVSIINTTAHSAHNICEYRNKLIYCDSNNSKLIVNNSCVFKTDTLLRGLSITDFYYIIGGSDIDFTGAKRQSSDCFIYVLDHQFNLLNHIRFSGIGNLMEIRQLASKDYALSN